MAITSTPRFGLAIYGAGSDSPSRVGFNTLVSTVDAKAAFDLGDAGGAALPTSDVVNGRYAATTNGSYRKLYRRAGGAWTQVGGNTWEDTTYARADTGLPTSGAARIVSHPNLTNPSATEYWDGSSSRGGLQAISDLNSTQPGALHVGSTDAVDLTNKGRVYARTTAANQRAFVASAHNANAGNLYSAVEPGGTVPWLVDPAGRMRAQAPSAFGIAALTSGVPLSAAPGASDTSAVDLYAASSGKYALRVMRAIGDSTPIATIAQDAIVLGRSTSTWSGGSVSVLGPRLTVGGALDVGGTATLGGLSVDGTITVDGLNVSGALDVNGATSLAGLTAGSTTLSSLTVSTTLKANGATTLAGLTAGTSSLGATTLSSLTVTGSTSLSGSLTLSGLTVNGNAAITGLLDLPVNRPSGNSSGQVRINTDYYTLEVYDGSNWHGLFGTNTAANSSGRKHGWIQTNGDLPGNDTYVQVSGFNDGNGGGSIASMSDGDLRLNRAGLWSLCFTMFCDNTSDGLNRLRIRWTNGSFPLGQDMVDIRTRQIAGAVSSGNGQATITWTGYVTSSQASNPIQMWVAQRGAGPGIGVLYAASAEYLGA